MNSAVQFGSKLIGAGHPTYIVGEIGINHNGDLESAKSLIDAAALAGCDAVKFQKRTPEVCVPLEQRDILRETPWGTMTYMDYRYRVEFDADQYHEIDRYCKEKRIDWFASCWDPQSVDFMEQFNPPGYKIASASLTDADLIKKHVATGRPIIVSTGMSTLEEIDSAIAPIDRSKLIVTPPARTHAPLKNSTFASSQRYTSDSVAPSATRGTKWACKPRASQSLWALASSSDTSPWTAHYGEAIKQPPLSRGASCDSCATSG